MKYEKTVPLRDGRELLIRSGREEDGEAVLKVFNQTHAETDFLLSYPDEKGFTVEQECAFLKENEESPNSIELIGWLDGRIAGSAGFYPIGSREKVRHRADFGISVLKECWGLGIGRALAEASIECARAAGFTQLELTVVAENERAVELYRRLGFVEFGRNPRGFTSRAGGYQEIVEMRLELN